MAEDDWQNSIYALKYTLKDPLSLSLSPSQVYMNQTNAMGIIETDHYDIKYHHSMIDDDNVNDSIKVKILYNEIMSLKTYFSYSERRLKAEISVLQDENRKLSNEIASIKQTLYFG